MPLILQALVTLAVFVAALLALRFLAIVARVVNHSRLARGFTRRFPDTVQSAAGNETYARYRAAELEDSKDRYFTRLCRHVYTCELCSFVMGVPGVHDDCFEGVKLNCLVRDGEPATL